MRFLTGQVSITKSLNSVADDHEAVLFIVNPHNRGEGKLTSRSTEDHTAILNMNNLSRNLTPKC